MRMAPSADLGWKSFVNTGKLLWVGQILPVMGGRWARQRLLDSAIASEPGRDHGIATWLIGSDSLAASRGNGAFFTFKLVLAVALD